MNYGFATKARWLLQYLRVKSKPSGAGAARPFAFHQTKADFLRLNADSFCPAEHFCLEDLAGNYLLERFRCLHIYLLWNTDIIFSTASGISLMFASSSKE